MPIPRKDLLLLFVGSILLTILTAIGFLYTLGYRLDRSNLSLVRSAILRIDSYPKEASIYLDNQLFGKTTNVEINDLNPGSLDVRVEKSDYQIWQRQIDLVEGLVDFLDYLILVPEEPVFEDFDLVTTNDDRYKLINYQVSSSRKTSLALTKSDVDYQLNYYQHDQSDGLEHPELLPIKQDQSLTTKSYPKLEIVKVGDNKNLLLRGENDKQEGYWFYYTGSDLIGLDQSMSIRNGELILVPNQPNKLVWVNNSELRVLNLTDKTIGPVITSKLYSYQSELDQIYIFTSDKDRLTLSQLDTGAPKLVSLLEDLGADQNIQVKHVDYRGADSLVIFYPDSQKLVWYRDYRSKLKTELLSSQATALKLSPDNRYLIWQDQTGWNTLDMYYPDQPSIAYPAELDDQMFWFDNHHLISNKSSSRIVDFDGSNSMNLSEQIVGPILFGLDGKDLVSINLEDKVFKRLKLVAR
ncbi:PEGA domain-containing protein [Candidatus Saccharibacteria bacterium]|nr:PEGA domain-containing protein [Candidatus Saccharibacteria bacterium]